MVFVALVFFAFQKHDPKDKKDILADGVETPAIFGI